MAESKGNPNAINWADPGGSVGLFQLNRGLGQGKGYTLAQLQNPIKNAELAAPSIAKAYRQAQLYGFRGNLGAVYTATHSGHPGYAPKGKIYPSPSAPSYKTFITEGKAVAAYYNSLSKGSPSARLGSAALPSSLQFNTSNLSQSAVLNSIAPGSAPIPSTNASTNGWEHMLLTMKDLQTGGLGGFITNPGRTVMGIGFFIMMIVFGIVLVGLGVFTLVKD